MLFKIFLLTANNKAERERESEREKVSRKHTINLTLSVSALKPCWWSVPLNSAAGVTLDHMSIKQIITQVGAGKKVRKMRCRIRASLLILETKVNLKQENINIYKCSFLLLIQRRLRHSISKSTLSKVFWFAGQIYTRVGGSLETGVASQQSQQEFLVNCMLVSWKQLLSWAQMWPSMCIF